MKFRGLIKELILKYKYLPGILLLLTTIVIFVGTLFPSNPSFSINIWDYDIWDYDKIGHFIMIGGWAFLYGLFKAFKSQKKPSLINIFILGSAFGLLIELLQFVIPTNRSPELMDLVADMLGALTAIGVLHFIFKKIFSTSAEPTT